MSEPKSIKDRLAAAKATERSVEVCLRGDLLADHESLERDLRRLRGSTASTMADQARQAELAERIDALQALMAEEMLTLTVRALPRSEWRSLVEKYPPRPDHQGDKVLGADFQSLMEEAGPRCVVDPELDESDWETLNTVLSSGDFDRIFSAVWEVNREGVDVPKSLLASRVMAERGDAQK